MLSLTLFEYFTRTLPEGFLLVLGICILCNIRIEKGKFIVSSIMLSILEYLVRELPINYGVHTILNIFIVILIIRKIFNIDIVISIKSTMILTIVLFVCEAINMIVLNVIFNDNVQKLILNQFTKNLCGVPSLILFSLILWFIYLRKKRRSNESY